MNTNISASPNRVLLAILGPDEIEAANEPVGVADHIQVTCFSNRTSCLEIFQGPRLIGEISIYEGLLWSVRTKENFGEPALREIFAAKGARTQERQEGDRLVARNVLRSWPRVLRENLGVLEGGPSINRDMGVKASGTRTRPEIEMKVKERSAQTTVQGWARPKLTPKLVGVDLTDTEAEVIVAGPVEAEPVEAEPVEAEAIETELVETELVETKPARPTKISEAKLSVAKSAEPEPKLAEVHHLPLPSFTEPTIAESEEPELSDEEFYAQSPIFQGAQTPVSEQLEAVGFSQLFNEGNKAMAEERYRDAEVAFRMAERLAPGDVGILRKLDRLKSLGFPEKP